MRVLPELERTPLVGHLPLAFDILALLKRSEDELGSAFAWQMAGRYVAVFSSAEATKSILLSQAEHLSAVDAFGPQSWMLGQGLARLDGLSHKRMKKLLLPAFHREYLSSHEAFVETLSTESLGHWKQQASIDLVSASKALTLSVILKSLFNISLADKPELAKELRSFFSCLVIESDKPLSFFGFLRMLNLSPLPNLRRRLDSFLFGLIDNPPEGKTTLALLKSAVTEEKHPLSKQEIRDQLLTFMVAGHDTTAMALAWTLYELAKNQDTYNKLKEELEQNDSSLSNLRSLPFLNAVIKEVLRLHPPICIGIRRALTDLEIDGFAIPKGSNVLYSPYLTHHSDMYWEQAAAFRPERFLESNPSRYIYLPFGAGQHSCIGMNLALLELQLIVSLLVKNSSWKLITDAQEKLSPTLEPAGVRLSFW